MKLSVLVRTRMNDARRELLTAFVALRRKQIDVATLSAVRSSNALRETDRALTEMELGREHDDIRQWIETTRKGLETLLAQLTAGGDLDAERCDAVGPANLRPFDGEEFEFVSVNLDRMTLPGSSMARSLVAWCTARHADFSGATFDHAQLAGSDFSDADFSRVSLRGVDVKASTFVGSVFRDAHIDGATFSRCDMRGANFEVCGDTSVLSLGARFIDCDLRETRWARRPMVGAIFARCKLDDARGLRTMDVRKQPLRN